MAGEEMLVAVGRGDDRAVLVVRFDASTGEFVAVRLFDPIRNQPLLAAEALHPDDRLNLLPRPFPVGAGSAGPRQADIPVYLNVLVRAGAAVVRGALVANHGGLVEAGGAVPRRRFVLRGCLHQALVHAAEGAPRHALVPGFRPDLRAAAGGDRRHRCGIAFMLDPQFVGAVLEAYSGESTHGFAAAPEGHRDDLCVGLHRFRFGRDESEKPLLARLFAASNNGVHGYLVRLLAASNNGAQGFLITGRDDVLVVRFDAATGEFVAVRLFESINGQSLLAAEALHPDDRLNLLVRTGSAGPRQAHIRVDLDVLVHAGAAVVRVALVPNHGGLVEPGGAVPRRRFVLRGCLHQALVHAVEGAPRYALVPGFRPDLRAAAGGDRRIRCGIAFLLHPRCVGAVLEAYSDEGTHGFSAAVPDGLRDDLCVNLDRVRLGRNESEERLLARLLAASDNRGQVLNTELAALLTAEVLVPNNGRVEAGAAAPRHAFHVAAGARRHGLIPDALLALPFRAMSCSNDGGLGSSPPSPATSTPAPPAACTPGAPTAAAPSPSSPCLSDSFPQDGEARNPKLNKKRRIGIRTKTRSTLIAQKNHKVLQFKGIWIGTINTQNTPKNDIRMLQFKGVLESFVFFALPSMLVFYPTGGQVKDEAAPCQMLMANGTINATNPNTEEKVVVAMFALFALIWIPALLLATFGKGKGCVSFVGGLTYTSVVAVVAFIVFALSKTMPETTIYSIIFVGYFIVLFCIVTYLWARYVWRAKYSLPRISLHSLPRISLHSLQVLLSTRIKWRKTQQENQLTRPLLDIV